MENVVAVANYCGFTPRNTTRIICNTFTFTKVALKWVKSCEFSFSSIVYSTRGKKKVRKNSVRNNMPGNHVIPLWNPGELVEVRIAIILKRCWMDVMSIFMGDTIPKLVGEKHKIFYFMCTSVILMGCSIGSPYFCPFSSFPFSTCVEVNKR